MTTPDFLAASAVRDILVARNALEILREQRTEAGDELNGNLILFRALKTAEAQAKAAWHDALIYFAENGAETPANEIAAALPMSTEAVIDLQVMAITVADALKGPLPADM